MVAKAASPSPARRARRLPLDAPSGSVRLASPVCCFLILLGFLGPRIAFAAWWIFGDKVDIAFDGWVWPLLGLLFLPWTTICTCSRGARSTA